MTHKSRSRYRSLQRHRHSKARCPHISCCILRMGHSKGTLRNSETYPLLCNVECNAKTGECLPHTPRCPQRQLYSPSEEQRNVLYNELPQFRDYPHPALLFALAEQTIDGGPDQPAIVMHKLYFVADCLRMMGQKAAMMSFERVLRQAHDSDVCKLGTVSRPRRNPQESHDWRVSSRDA